MALALKETSLFRWLVINAVFHIQQTSKSRGILSKNTTQCLCLIVFCLRKRTYFPFLLHSFLNKGCLSPNLIVHTFHYFKLLTILLCINHIIVLSSYLEAGLNKDYSKHWPVACLRGLCEWWIGVWTPGSVWNNASHAQVTQSPQPPWYSCIGCAPERGEQRINQQVHERSWTWINLFDYATSLIQLVWPGVELQQG